MTVLRGYLHEEKRAGVSMLLPSLAVISAFVVFPVGYSLYISLHQWSLIRGQPAFIGLGNFATALNSPAFWNALWNTAFYAVGTVAGAAILGLAAAMLLNKGIRAVGLYRTAIFLPEVSSTIVVGLLWLWVFDPHHGLANNILSMLSLPTSRWLADPNWAMPALIVMSIWQSAGYNMVIYLAALQNVPEELHEAAMMDGAGPWARFRRITLPLLMPATAFVVIMGTIKSFQVFGQVYVMTRGGPMGSTSVLVFYLYEQAFESFRIGYASSVAWLLALLIFTMTLIQFRALRSRE